MCFEQDTVLCVLLLVVSSLPGVGDYVEEDEVIAEIETDKVSGTSVVHGIPILSLPLPLSPSPSLVPLSSHTRLLYKSLLQ